MLFSYCSGQQQINDNKNAGKLLAILIGHADVAVRRGVHRPMEHIQGFTRSHWMPPSSECLHHINPVAAMVDEFVQTIQNTNKRQLLVSNYSTDWALVVCKNFIPQNGPSTQLINVSSWVKIWDSTIGAEDLAHNSSYQTLSANKNGKSN